MYVQKHIWESIALAIYRAKKDSKRQETFRINVLQKEITALFVKDNPRFDNGYFTILCEVGEKGIG